MMVILISLKDNRQISRLDLVCKVEGVGSIRLHAGIAYCQFTSFLSSAVPLIQF